jgi:SAM-dependent methyltransferase
MKKEELLAARDRAGTWGRLNPDRLELVLAQAGRKVLDVGCATGAYVRFLVDRGYDAYGIDLLPSEEWAAGPAGRFREGDILNLPYPAAAFDTVLAFEVLEHVEDTDRALSELKRVAPDDHPPFPTAMSRRFREAASPSSPDRPTHVRLFTADTLTETLLPLAGAPTGRINRVGRTPFIESLRQLRLLKGGLARLVAICRSEVVLHDLRRSR